MKAETKNKVILALIAVIPATVSGILSNCQATYEARLKSNRVEKKSVVNSNATIESLRPAILELQGIQDKASKWAGAVDEDIDQLKRDVEYCKAYIDFASRGSYKEKYSESSPVAVELDEPDPVPKPRAKIPDNVGKAKAYQEVRQKMACSPSDPACGAFVLE